MSTSPTGPPAGPPAGSPAGPPGGSHVPPLLPPEAAAAPAPLSVAALPLTYAHGAYRSRRPGTVVALGVLSVIVGLAGVVIGPAAVFRVRALYRTVVPPGAVAAAPTAASSPSAPPPPALWPGVRMHFGDCVAERGLKAPARDAAVEAVAAAPGAGGLHPDRREMLRRLLAECGQDVFGAASLTPDRAHRAVREAGRRDAGPDGPRGLAAQFFRTGAGTVEVNNKSATFTPAAGGAPLKVECNRVTAPDGSVRYSAVALDRILTRVHRDTGGGLNAAQAGALLADLRQIAPDADAATSFHPLPYVSAGRVGTATLDVQVSFSGATRRFWLMPNGRYVASPQPDWDPDTGTRRVFVPFAPAPRVPAPSPILVEAMDRFYAYGVADAALSTALALLLAVAGVRTLVHGPESYRLHRWYVVIKVALVICGVVMGQSLFDDLAGALGGRWNEMAALGGLFIGTAVALAYPVFVFCVCATAGVRDYYQSIGGPLTLVSDGTRERVRRTFFATDWARWPPAARRALAVAAAAVAAFHAVAAFTPGHDNGTVLAHFALMLLAAAVACVGWWGLMLRPRAALLVALSAACLLAGVWRAAAAARAEDDLPADWRRQVDRDELKRMTVNELVLRAQFGQTRVQRKAALEDLQGREDCKQAFALLMRLFPTLDAQGRNDICEALTFVNRGPDEWNPDERAAVGAALPAMLELFGDPGPAGERAGQWLARFYPADAVLPAAIKLLDPSSPWRMRFRAVLVLRDVREPTEDVYRALVPALADPDQNVSNAAGNLLESARPRSLPVLTEAASKAPSPAVRAAALGVMARDDGRPRGRRGGTGDGLAPEVVAALEAGLRDPDADVRAMAVVMIRTSHPQGLERLLRMLVEGDGALRALAAREIGRADARRAVPEARKLLAHRDPSVRAAAVAALQRYHPPGETSAPEVYALLDDPDARARAAAAEWFVQTPGRAGAGVLGLWSEVTVEEARQSGSSLRARYDVAPVTWEPPPGVPGASADGTDGAGGAWAAIGSTLAGAADRGLWLQWPVFGAFALALAAHLVVVVRRAQAHRP